MRHTLLLFILFLVTTLIYAEGVPSKLDVTRRDKGEHGYYKVKQSWTGEDSGRLLCEKPGYTACVWQYSGSDGYPIDLDSYSELILESFESDGTTSGTMIIGEISFHYWVLESFGEGEGTVRFEFLSIL